MTAGRAPADFSAQSRFSALAPALVGPRTDPDWWPNPPAMRTLLSLLVLALAAGPLPAREVLRQVLHPSADLPAFHGLVPAGWRQEVDASGNLQLGNEDRSANFSLNVIASPDPAAALDELAQAILSSAVVAPWDSRVPFEVSGHRGFKYAARVRHTNGVEARAEVILIAAGERHIAVCSMILADRVTPAQETTARLVQAGLRLIPAR